MLLALTLLKTAVGQLDGVEPDLISTHFLPKMTVNEILLHEEMTNDLKAKKKRMDKEKVIRETKTPVTPKPVLAQMLKSFGFDGVSEQYLDPMQILPGDLKESSLSDQAPILPNLTEGIGGVTGMMNSEAIGDFGIETALTSITPWISELHRLSKIKAYYEEEVNTTPPLSNNLSEMVRPSAA